MYVPRLMRKTKPRAGGRSAHQAPPDIRSPKRRKHYTDARTPRMIFWRVFILVGLIAVPPLAFAQATPDGTTVLLSGSHFFIAMLAGIILAVAFQLVLTSLSAAVGLNALAGTTSLEERRKNRVHKNSKKNKGPHRDEAGPVRKISSAFGLWALITATITLFFSSWLAVKLALTPSRLIGAVLGLVIWGLFFVFMTVIEANAVSSLIGTLVRMATGGLRAVYKMTSGLLSRSDENRIADTAAKITDKVKEELVGDIDTDDIKDTVQEYIEKLNLRRLDPDEIRDNIADMLSDYEVRAIHDAAHEFGDEYILKVVPRHTLTKRQIQTVSRGIRGAFDKVREEYKSQKDPVSKVIDSALRLAGVSKDDAERYRLKAEEYLRSTGRQELDPESLKQDLVLLFREPSAGRDAMKERFSHLNRETINSLVTTKTDVSPEQANRAMDKTAETYDKAKESVEDTYESARGAIDSAKNSVTAKIRNYLDTSDIPGLDWDGLEADFKKLFSDPKQGWTDLVRRLRSLDRDTLKAIIASRDDMTEEDAERLLVRMEQARDKTIERANRFVEEAKHRAAQARDEAWRQVDEARKTAATAAWWVLASAVVSGIAAVIGGMLGALPRI